MDANLIAYLTEIAAGTVNPEAIDLAPEEARALLDEIERLQREVDRRDVLIAWAAGAVEMRDAVRAIGLPPLKCGELYKAAKYRGCQLAEQARKEAQGGE